MKTWKLVSGVLSIILFFIVALQSCAAGMVNAMEANGGSSGSAGILVGILMLAGGIVSIAILILFGLAALIGLAGHGNYSDLVIWSFWCLLNAILAVIAMVKNR